MANRIDFGTRAAANQARDAFDIDDDRRYTGVDVSDVDLPEHDLDRLYGMAADARLDTAGSAGQAALTEAEKHAIDFSEVTYFEAAAAKATLRSEGVDDWTSMLDQTLTLDETKGMVGSSGRRRLKTKMQEMGRPAAIGRAAVKDPTGRRMRGIDEAADETVARGHHQYAGGIEKHAIEGARKGSADAKAELRRMGWSERDIREIVTTGQVRAALTPGQTVRLSGGFKTTPRTWAKAKRSHEHRRVRSQYVDEARRAPLTTDYEKWHNAPHRYDFPGVDTRRPRAAFFDDEERARSFGRLTDDLWKWQTGGDNRL